MNRTSLLERYDARVCVWRRLESSIAEAEAALDWTGWHRLRRRRDRLERAFLKLFNQLNQVAANNRGIRS